MTPTTPASAPTLRLDVLNISPVKLSRIHKILYRRAGKPAYIVGERFVIKLQFTNIGDFIFPECKLMIQVRWPEFDQPDHYIINIPEVDKGDSTETLSFSFGLLEPGYGRITLDCLEGGSGTLFEINKREINLMRRTHIASVYAQTVEEFYQYWAMIFAVIGVFYIIVKDLVGDFAYWIFGCLIFLMTISVIASRASK